jgi:hypothetical protein
MREMILQHLHHRATMVEIPLEMAARESGVAQAAAVVQER